MRSSLWQFLVAVPLTAGGCSSTPTEPAYDLIIPTAWAAAVTHPLFPLVPGTTSQYRKQTPAGLETVTIEVLPTPKTVNGVKATAVRDRVFLNGVLTEDTFDWYAQDVAGNV